ncbi:sortilin-related receptor-like [Oppia nitens]|uniref:sortilin-related receptor-like n=1 Tax=Oppia nitens TaxID=1686743 RepID=UPI0023DAE1F7|nr:sortilin-related receptor-like [Oppia nitens]
MSVKWSIILSLIAYLLAIVSIGDSFLVLNKALIGRQNDDTFATDLSSIEISADKDWPMFREKRSTNNSVSGTSPKPIVDDDLSQFVTSSTLNDSHQQLTVHWSGKGSSVIICLAKNRPTNPNVSSAVYISENYGKDFSKVSQFKLKNESEAVINNFYISPAINSHYIFVDIINNCLFITKDYGKNLKRVDLPFIQMSISLHSTNVDLVLMTAKINDTDTHLKLYLSEDFGANWRPIQERVKQFSWGVEGIDTEANGKTIFVQRHEPNGLTSILSSSDFFANEMNTKIWLNNVDEFEISGKYMFATRRLKLLGAIHNPKIHDSYQLWVSYKRHDFRRALFPTSNQSSIIDYYIADASEEVVMTCLTFNDSTTHLYASDENGLQFSLSLDNILYFALNVTRHPLSIDWNTEEPLADIHKVGGIRGVYIASKWKEPKKSIADLITVITFDMGAKWQRIRPPFIDADGVPIECSSTVNCSLHLSQKFSYLYPSLRLPPIVSRSSSVGLIMASGVVGTSIKGKPNVYLSIDAGITWHQVLNGNYIFTFGDFGAIIVAISYYSRNGSTNELKYSIDDGENWTTFKFSEQKIRIYGLMTEPGEKTTVFTLFGSKADSTHEWTVIQVNLTKVFKSHCSLPDDYKEWSPHDMDSGCLLGRREVFHRRIANHRCFNGQNYVRPVASINCPCRHTDFECDVGFIRDKNGAKCVFDDRSSIEGYDPFSVPDWCKVGLMFNRTRGYRKISGDTCIGGEEDWYSPQEIPCPFGSKHDDQFVLFVQRQAISRLMLNEENPIKESLVPHSYLINAIASDFDHKHNCLYWSDIGIDKIMRLCLDGRQSQPEVLVETGLESVEGIALNTINNQLYFVDGEQSKVELIRTDITHEGRMRRTILKKPHIEKPRGIALNVIIGYIFLTDWGTNKPSIIRSELDGDNVKVLFNDSIVSWPNGIAVDYLSQRIFWVDAKRDYIASADFDGHHLSYISEGDTNPHPFALGVFKNHIYFDDWNLQQIIMINKNDGSDRRVILSDIVGAMDLKIITPYLKDIMNSCSDNKTSNCSHLCVPKLYGGHKCLCPDGLDVTKAPDGNEMCVCRGGEELTKTGACKPKKDNQSCSNEEFMCDNGLCIQKLWKCDRDNDCGDGSDERDCADHQCNENEFQCKRSNKCIPSHWKCDFDSDCMDGSDEDLSMCASVYPKCNESTQFQCKNLRCIEKKLICDLEDNCRDGSDEENCMTKNANEKCKDDEFRCKNGDCILSLWRCDGDNDCRDKSDETNCSKSSCNSWQFLCDHSKCIFNTWKCDGEYDCKDQTDEIGCNGTDKVIPTSNQTTTTSTANPLDSCAGDWFRCATGICVPLIWRCDRVDDCGDNSDETGCDHKNPLPTAGQQIPETNIKDNCGPDRYQCLNGQCIWDSWLCDSQKDCESGEDEENCNFGPKNCSEHEFKCVHSLGCIPLSDVCNGKDNCGDGSDEWGCRNEKTDYIKPHKCIGFTCKSGECVELYKRCNHRPDCFDSSDEDNCTQTFYAVNDLQVDLKSITATEFTIQWKTPSSFGIFNFMPTIAKVNTSEWHNMSWTQNESFRFDKLKPGVVYNVTVFCKFTNESHFYLPLQYITVTTESIAPSPPLLVKAIELSENRVLIKWLSPLLTYGTIKGYRIYYSPPYPSIKETTGVSSENSLLIDRPFETGVKYTFWMTTLTVNLESEYSNKTSLIINGSIITIKNLHSKSVTNSSITIEWNSSHRESKESIKWMIEYRCDDYFVGFIGNTTTDETHVTVDGLSPGVNYQFKVLPVINGSVVSNGIEDNIITVITTGVMLPHVDIKEKSVFASAFYLTWDQPIYVLPVNWTYGVFYGIEEKRLKLYAKTNETTITVTGLLSCESYILQVRVLKPYGVGPAIGSTIMKTQYDPIAAPKNLKYSMIVSDKTKYILSWNSSCDKMSKTPVVYRICIRDLVKNRDNWFQLSPRNTTSIEMPLYIHFGATYEIKVGTDNQNARYTRPLRLTPTPLPRVTKLDAIQQYNGSLYIIWKTIDDNVWPKELRNHSYSYKVYISTEPNTDEVDIRHIPRPPLIYPAQHGKYYHISVALVEEHGYSGPVSDTIIIGNHMIPSYGENAVVIQRTSVIGVVVGIGIIVTALVIALAIFVTRHRRLQRSFLQFASSHYNTRSDSATFTTNDGLEEEDESPVFRGFSDDEPLVLA